MNKYSTTVEVFSILFATSSLFFFGMALDCFFNADPSFGFAALCAIMTVFTGFASILTLIILLLLGKRFSLAPYAQKLAIGATFICGSLLLAAGTALGNYLLIIYQNRYL
jgi:hypothetical protein